MNPKILIVDDDADFREWLALILRRQGYSVLEASSGYQAISYLQADEAVELILSDYYMDEGSGKDLLDWVRARDARKPVFLLITGQAEFDLKDSELDGVQEYIQKPFDTKRLLQVIRNYMSTKKSVL